MFSNNTLIIILLILIFIYFKQSNQRKENFIDLYEPDTYQAEQVIREIYHELPPECNTTLNNNAINRIVPLLKSLSFIDFKNDIFYHIDCECGRAVLEFWLKTGISSKGISTESSRLDIANRAKTIFDQRTDMIPKTYLPPHNAVEYLNSQLPSNDANIIYAEKMSPNLLKHLFTLPNLKVIIFSGKCPPSLSQQLHQKFPKHVNTIIPTNNLNKQDQTIHLFHI